MLELSYSVARPFDLHLDFCKSRSWELKVCFKPQKNFKSCKPRFFLRFIVCLKQTWISKKSRCRLKGRLSMYLKKNLSLIFYNPTVFAQVDYSFHMKKSHYERNLGMKSTCEMFNSCFFMRDFQVRGVL